MGRILLLIFVFVSVLVLVAFGIPMAAAHVYGPPSSQLTALQVVQYSARLLWDDGLVTEPRNSRATDVEFEVQQAEPVDSICRRLVQLEIVRDGSAMRDYLVYTGLDTKIQAGRYRLSAAMSAMEIGQKMQDSTPADVTFVVLPGWRIEEIAASLPTSGLEITPQEFIASASAPPAGDDFLSGATTTEGFLFPDAYILARTVNVDEFIRSMVRNFAAHLDSDRREGYQRQNLTVYQAVTLASIVQREAVLPEEAPLIASVYLNRLRNGMRLDADPTIQYALGYNAIKGTWWTNPLSLEDLKLPSPYNTYLNHGLPPAPIDNPGPTALQAVASPADSPYYYFSARCDGSGYHVFAQTFEEHLRNLCP